MKMYLGDGLYAEDRGHDIELHTTGAKGEKRNQVYLGHGEIENLLSFIEVARGVKFTTTRRPKFSQPEENRSGAY